MSEREIVREALQSLYERLEDFEDEYGPIKLGKKKLSEIINEIINEKQ